MNTRQASPRARALKHPIALGLGLVLCAACGRGDDKPKDKPQVFDAGATPHVVKPSPPSKVPAKPPAVFKDNGDEAAALAKLGALPAWSAVAERYRLLSRRDQSGVVTGLVVEHEGALRLVDEERGMGVLSIPITIPDSVKLSPPARVVLWGAWEVGEGADFVWRATRVEALSSPPSSPEFSPGLLPRERAAPDDVLLASTISRSGGALAFQVHQREERVGDGWLISDVAGGPPVARLLLPGEEASYGDQSRLTESERWQLKKAGLYWVEIDRFRPPTDGSLPLFRANTPPFGYEPPPAPAAPPVKEAPKAPPSAPKAIKTP